MDQLALGGPVGFIAQLIDGALGMAYGTIMALTLLALGLPPAVTGASVNLAEIFTCSPLGLAHTWYRNVDWRLVGKLAPAGVIGAILGAATLSSIDGAIFEAAARGLSRRPRTLHFCGGRSAAVRTGPPRRIQRSFR